MSKIKLLLMIGIKFTASALIIASLVFFNFSCLTNDYRQKEAQKEVRELAKKLAQKEAQLQEQELAQKQALAEAQIRVRELEELKINIAQIMTQNKTRIILGGDPSKYNIEMEPKRSSSPLALIPGEETKITFFIGPKSIASLVGDLSPSNRLHNLAAGKSIELTVTLFSSVSAADTFQQRKVIFDPGTGCSDAAEFKIRPQPEVVKENGNIGKLIFVVDAKGMEIDVIQLDAIVGNPAEAALAKYSPPAKLGFQDILPEDIRMPDLILAIAPEEEGRLPIIVRPIHPDLIKLLQEALDDKAHDYWKFSSGVSVKDMEGLVRNAYLALTALMEQKQKDLQEKYGAKLSNGAGMLFFSDQDQATAFTLIGREGAQLFWRIFCQGSPKLRSAMQSIFQQSLVKNPLKLRIISTNLYVPWQILYSDSTLTEPIKPELFWGFRYKLGTTQLVSATIGRTRTAMGRILPQDVLFGAWNGSSIPVKEDLVKLKGEDLNEYLKIKLRGEIRACTNKSDFISLITSQAIKVKLIFLYGHGSSGTTLFIGNSLLTGLPMTIAAPSIIGPYFKFTDKMDDFLIPRDFDLLSACVSADDPNPAFFKNQPIVILNACETGTAGMGTADNSGFIGALTRAGARAVIVTEAPVWSNFAQFFGRDLVEELLAGEDVQGALLKVRLNHLKNCKNPFGLYYSLYGNQAAYIKK